MSVTKAFEVVGGGGAQAGDSVALSYEQRLLRRKKLTTQAGEAIFLDLPQTVSLQSGDGIKLADGRMVAVDAANEELLAITGDTVTRYAWHIGNRHTPCEIAPDRLVIQRDPVLKAMLEYLGATVTEIIAPFCPEGGAYGHGRTLGHEHGVHEHGVHEHGGHEHGSHDHEGDDHVGAVHEGEDNGVHSYGYEHEHEHAHPHPHGHTHD